MTSIEEWVVVALPAETAYERWLGIDDLPEHVWGIERVRRHADRARTSWTVWAGGRRISFDVELTEVAPGRRIAWRSLTGPEHEGSVSFMGLGDGRSTEVVEVTGDPGGTSERATAVAGALRRGIRDGLAGFKRAAEGTWRPDDQSGRVAA